MTTTWVVVAHQTGARIMEHRSGFGRHLVPVHELHHSEKHEHTAHEHAMDGFVHTLVHEIDTARVAGRFDALILVADPKLLGALRAGLHGPTARTLVASVSKDLAAVPTAQVADHISSVLPL